MATTETAPFEGCSNDQSAGSKRGKRPANAARVLRSGTSLDKTPDATVGANQVETAATPVNVGGWWCRRCFPTRRRRWGSLPSLPCSLRQ